MRFLKLPSLEEPAQYKRHIIGPIDRKKSKDYRNLTKLLGAVCLRRTKVVLSLEPVTDITHLVNFEPEERADYTRIERVCKDAFDLAVSGHKIKEVHQTILEILLRLRLFCNNGSMYNSGSGYPQAQDPTETLSLMEQRGEAICYFCSCDVAEMQDCGDRGEDLVTPCNQIVCAGCIPLWRAGSSEHTSCPICSKQHSNAPATRATPQYNATNNNYPSKMLALCRNILAHKDDGKWYNPPLSADWSLTQCSIVFSFWKRSLDIVGALLNERGLPFIRVDGSVPSARRKALLEQFEKQYDVPVLLMTFGTGAVGWVLAILKVEVILITPSLNGLSVANRIHILEPQWNPSVESQAIGRVVRLGQERPVTVIRYLVDRTVEKVVMPGLPSSVLRLTKIKNVQNKQLRKLTLAHNGFAHRKSEDSKARMQLLQVRPLYLT
jgi:SWI/SNF-related matrix-associated actin-dependent regulator of chromatin subfamily A3